MNNSDSITFAIMNPLYNFALLLVFKIPITCLNITLLYSTKVLSEGPPPSTNYFPISNISKWQSQLLRTCK